MNSVKHLCLSLIFCSIIIQANAQFREIDHFYYYKNSKINLKLDRKKAYVKFKSSSSLQKRVGLASFHFSLNSKSKKNLSQSNLDFSIIEFNDDFDENGLTNKLSLLKNDSIVLQANPIFISSDSTRMAITDQFLVKLNDVSQTNILDSLVFVNKISIVKQDGFDPAIFILKCNKNSHLDAMQLANRFYQTGLFEFSEPDFFRLNVSLTNDEFYYYQTNLKNTGQTNGVVGADINIEPAWGITRGNPNIKIAVIDLGVELSHPDLAANLLPGYDATGNNSNGAPTGQDYHGTACAGIIGAVADNGIGIAGVANKCKIIPIRIAINNGFQDTWSADGINWAWQNGADVLSNSWGGGSPSSVVDAAITNAVTYGRAGLGCVVVFATGNGNSSQVSWPASNINVISVGAINKFGTRSSYSNYGLGLDVVAPGGSGNNDIYSEIYTTDLSGPAGKSSTEYTSTFSGTSAACPHVAGVAALILSVNKCLTFGNVEKIIEVSCSKLLGGVCYSPTYGKPFGTWNNELGYGRLNAFDAIQYAYSTQVSTFNNVTGVDQGASSTYSFSILGSGCQNLAAANYLVKRHQFNATVTYPYTENAVVIGTANGLSLASPNPGDYFMGISSITPTSTIAYTYLYELVNTLGQHLGWFPRDPSYLRFYFNIASALNTDMYFQNQQVLSTQIFNAMNKIEAGNNVTTLVSVGDYVIKNGADITFHAGNSIYLKDGFKVEPGAKFLASVNPFFTCSQYPNGIGPNKPYNTFNSSTSLQNRNDNFISESKQLEINYNSDGFASAYPNPFNSIVQFDITSSTNDYSLPLVVKITDVQGKLMYQFDNNAMVQSNIFIPVNTEKFKSGVYFYEISWGALKKHGKILKVIE